MDLLKICFFSVLIIWYIFYVFFVIYLYFNNSKMYELETFVDVKKINRSLNDLSLIIYKKIKPEVLTASIVRLINKGFIKIKREGNDLVLIKINDDDLSKSDFNILELLFETIGNNNKVSLEKINKFCDKKSGCSSFLMNYEIWKKMVIVESSRNNLFEPKLEYNMVKFVQRVGYLLFVLNIILKINSLLGFFVIIPAIFIIVYFYNISKLTKECTQEYYGWLDFRKELKTDENLLDNNDYLEYSIILRCFDNIKQDNKREFIKYLDLSIKKCYTNSILNGNRSLFKK